MVHLFFFLLSGDFPFFFKLTLFKMIFQMGVLKGVFERFLFPMMFNRFPMLFFPHAFFLGSIHDSSDPLPFLGE